MARLVVVQLGNGSFSKVLCEIDDLITNVPEHHIRL